MAAPASPEVRGDSPPPPPDAPAARPPRLAACDGVGGSSAAVLSASAASPSPRLCFHSSISPGSFEYVSCAETMHVLYFKTQGRHGACESVLMASSRLEGVDDNSLDDAPEEAERHGA